MRVTWTTRRSNQSILKEISPEYSLEALMLKHILWPPNALGLGKDPMSLGNDPMLGKTEGRKRRGGQRVR